MPTNSIDVGSNQPNTYWDDQDAIFKAGVAGKNASPNTGGLVPVPAGISSGQVPEWNGTTWVAATPSGLPIYKTLIGDGATKVFTVTHNLADLDVMVTVIDKTLNQIVYPTVGAGSLANSVTVTFSVAPTTNQMRVIVGAF